MLSSVGKASTMVQKAKILPEILASKWALVHVPDSPLQSQLPTHGLGKAANDGQKA